MFKDLSFVAIVLWLASWAPVGNAHVITVDSIEKSLFFSSVPTKTFLWESPRAKGTLVFFPGGQGQIGLSDGQRNVGGFAGNTIRPLADAQITSGVLNVVVFDSPISLPGGVGYPSSRTTPEHMMRMESVVLYYKEKFKLPIFLMGHSNGAVSVTEFYKYLQKKNSQGLVSGVVYSSARNGAAFNSSTTNLPVLFLAHAKDGCAESTNSNSQSAYEDLKKVDLAEVRYVFINGGTAQADSPCRSGYHMFFGASDEAYQAIDVFVRDLLK